MGRGRCISSGWGHLRGQLLFSSLSFGGGAHGRSASRRVIFVGYFFSYQTRVGGEVVGVVYSDSAQLP